jgi:glycosyltransferase involved in cell wall biosynthesis
MEPLKTEHFPYQKIYTLNKFDSTNVTPWYKWIFMENDSISALTFYFLSRKNSTSGRYLPLLNEMKSVRIVLIKGTRIGQLDRIQLKFVALLKVMTIYKQKKYRWLLIYSLNKFNTKVSQVLDIDDPSYKIEEINRIIAWERELAKRNLRSAIVTTNDFTKNYLIKSKVQSKIYLVGQGHRSTPSLKLKKFNEFSLVFTSPYIDYVGDRHANHETWGAKFLIEEILPEITSRLPDVSIHIIGRTGKHAFKRLNLFPNIVLHGLKSQNENFTILRKCHVGLYPRNHDNFRRVLKIYEYIGAGLPVVTFDLEDTSLIREFNLGISVESVNDFVDAVQALSENKKLYDTYVKNIKIFGQNNSWPKLAHKYDFIIEK